jgi:copper/silver efflux system protein
MVSSTLLTLIVIPAVYALIKGWRLPANSSARRDQEASAAA